MADTVHSPFGPRKVRAPPPSSETTANNNNNDASITANTSAATPSSQTPMFGERKTRLPPPQSSDTTSAGVAASPQVQQTSTMPQQSLFGERKSRAPPPNESASPSSSSNKNNNSLSPQVRTSGTTNSSPFGQRLSRAPSVVGSNPAEAATSANGSSPFGPTLRSQRAAAFEPQAAAAVMPQQQQQPSSSSSFGVRPPLTTSGSSGGSGVPPTTPAQGNNSGGGVGGQRTIALPASGRHVPLVYLERIEGCLLYRLAVQRVRARRVLNSVTLVQQEYRDFLKRSGSSDDRAMLRLRKLEVQRRLHEKLAVVGLQARESGAAIAQEEAAEWFLLQRSSLSLHARCILLSEEQRRARIETEAVEDFRYLFHLPNPNVPSFVRPGVERDEWTTRAHTLQFERFERVKLASREIAERGALTIIDEQNNRRGILDAQHALFVQLLRHSRVDYWDSTLREEEEIEGRFRRVIEHQRLRFMSLLTRQSAAALALSFIQDEDDLAARGGGGGGYTEAGYRNGILEKEAFYWKRMCTAFHEQRYFLHITSVQRAEYHGRCGGNASTSGHAASGSIHAAAVGIEIQERRERQAIHLAMIRGALMYVQGFDVTTDSKNVGHAVSRLGDRHSESGSRATILFAEDRERRALEHTLNTDAVYVFLPAIEMRQRQRLLEQEKNELRGVIRVIGVVPLLFCLQEEPIPRRRLFEEWQNDTVGHIFHFARIRLLGQEIRIRVHAFQQQEMFHERLVAWSYLARVEVTERRLLRKAVKSLNRRVRQEGPYSNVYERQWSTGGGGGGGHHNGAKLTDHRSPLFIEDRVHQQQLSLNASPREHSRSALVVYNNNNNNNSDDAASPPVHRPLHLLDSDSFRGTPFFDRMHSGNDGSAVQRHSSTSSKALEGLFRERAAVGLNDGVAPAAAAYAPIAVPSTSAVALSLSPRRRNSNTNHGHRDYSPSSSSEQQRPRGVSQSLLHEVQSRYHAIVSSSSRDGGGGASTTAAAAAAASFRATDSRMLTNNKMPPTPSSTMHRGHSNHLPHSNTEEGRGVVALLLEPPSPSDAALLSTRSMSLSAGPLNATSSSPFALLDASPRLQQQQQLQHQLDVDEMLDGTTWTEWLRGDQAGEFKRHQQQQPPPSRAHSQSVVDDEALRRERVLSLSSSTPPRASSQHRRLNSLRGINSTARANISPSSSNVYFAGLSPTLLSRVSPPMRVASSPAAKKNMKTPDPKRQSTNSHKAKNHYATTTTPPDGRTSTSSAMYFVAQTLEGDDGDGDALNSVVVPAVKVTYS
ncbi:Hypothetical protein, putative [Bodo saltans]|uniref:Uncharacterized protein n=1 Tax=Bodo saltans TaxID=75058 RepID=A0A0S4JJV2_BODSA|nr:Hypothetical protein, putative [Bodo saltans]|eukprot:CUG90433.1 Hypothetical protein, putative [Bodo saltans]